MNKIDMKIDNDRIIFSIDDDKVSNTTINTISSFHDFNYKFSESYFLSNMEIVSKLLEEITSQYHMDTVEIKSLEISSSVLKGILSVSNIKKVIFSFSSSIDYSICFDLLENRNLEYIECYNLPDIMYHRFPEGVMKVRCELLFISDFMKNNHIHTYSDVCSKQVIKMESYLTTNDMDDLEYLLSENKSLKIIKIFSYQKQDLLIILNMLKKHNKKDVAIWIYENSSNTAILLDDISLFRNYKTEYNIDILVQYSKTYQLKNRMKQLNISLLQTTISFIALTALVMAGILYYQKQRDYHSQEKNKDAIQNVVNDSVSEVGIVELDPVLEEGTHPINPYQSTYENQMLKLLEMNSDTVGWLKVNETDIDYPVVQATDNDYYLNYAFDKTKNHAGWIFADYRNRLDNTDKNIIIYGHRVRNTNLMFTTLQNVLEEEWYQNPNNLSITFNMKDELITWKVFSIYTIEKTNDYIQTDFKTDDKFLDFIHMIQSRSIVDFEEEVLETDQILTLSTCYLDSNHRLVVHAKRIRSF